MGRAKVRTRRSKAKSSLKKSHKKIQLPKVKANESSDQKIYKKLPGFDAFNVLAPSQPRPRGKKNGRTLVECRVATPPETGIHVSTPLARKTKHADSIKSLEWAAAIVPQRCGFLRLPFEVRRKIYDLVIDDFVFDTIEPRKNGNKFYSPNWPNAAQETTALYQLCRQTYVDVVGSGLLYSAKTFFFTSPTLMLNYLWVINPVHKDAIRSIELWISFTHRHKTLPSKAIEFLAGCKGLRYLELRLDFDRSTCEMTRIYSQKRFAVSEKMLAKIRDWDSLRQIKGLLSFDLRIVSEESNIFVYGWTPGAEDRYRQLEEDLRIALLEE